MNKEEISILMKRVENIEKIVNNMRQRVEMILIELENQKIWGSIPRGEVPNFDDDKED